MEGCLPEKDLARFVVEIVETDTSAIEGAYEGGGGKPYL